MSTPALRFVLFAAFCLLASPVFADRYIPAAGESVRSDYDRILSNMRVQFSPYSETTAVSRGGRTDRVMLTKASWESIVHRFQNAHRVMSVLGSGGRVAGWYTNKTKRTATFTVHLGGHSYTIAAQELPAGTRIVLWGDARSHEAMRSASKKGSSRSHRGRVSPGLRRL